MEQQAHYLTPAGTSASENGGGEDLSPLEEGGQNRLNKSPRRASTIA